MKKWICLLTCLPMTVLAAAFSMKNQGGGEIVITDRDCKLNGKSYAPLKEAYAYLNDGKTIQGCWLVKDGMVEVIWSFSGSAETRLYQVTDFKEKVGI